MNPVKIEAGGNSHVFDPPSVDYYDQIYRRGTDLYDSLQLDWVYLFISMNTLACTNILQLNTNYPAFHNRHRLVHLVSESARFLDQQ